MLDKLKACSWCGNGHASTGRMCGPCTEAETANRARVRHTSGVRAVRESAVDLAFARDTLLNRAGPDPAAIHHVESVVGFYERQILWRAHDLGVALGPVRPPLDLRMGDPDHV